MAVNRSSSSRSSGSSSSRSSGGSRPRSHERRTSSGSSRSASRRGSGLNLGGPVGNSGGYEGRPGTGYGDYRERSRGGSGMWILVLVILLAVVAINNGGGLSKTFESVMQTVKGETENLDTDEIKSQLGDIIQGAGISLGDAASSRNTNSGKASKAKTREVVDAFSGVLTNQSGDVIQALASDFVPTQQLSSGLIDESKLVWTENGKGERVLKLSDEEWDHVESLKLNVFIDDGEGFIDLGLDEFYEFDDNEDLLGEYDGTWMCFDDYPVAFYHLTTIEDGDKWRMIGYVPAFLNNEHVSVIVAFDDKDPAGYIAGVKPIKKSPGTDLSVEEMVSDLKQLKEGDKLDFICDYYDYDGVFINNYFLGEQMTVGKKDPTIMYYHIPGELSAVYRIEDTDGNIYWTPEM